MCQLSCGVPAETNIRACDDDGLACECGGGIKGGSNKALRKEESKEAACTKQRHFIKIDSQKTTETLMCGYVI